MQETIRADQTDRNELGNLSLRDLFFKYIRFLPLFVLSVAVMLFGAYIYLRYVPRIYSAGSTLLIKSEQQKGNSDRFEDLFMNNKVLNVQSEIEVLKSRSLMDRVVKRLNLQTGYTAVGRIRNENVYKQGPFLLEIFDLTDSSRPFSMNFKFVNDSSFHIDNGKEVFNFGQLFKNVNGIFRLTKNPLAAVGREYIVSWQPSLAIAGTFTSNLQVVPKNPGTGILNLTLQGTNPKLCEDVVNQLMEEYEQLTIEEKSSTAELTLHFIDDRMDSLGHELDSVQKVLLGFMLKNDVINLDVQSSNYFQTLTETDKNINGLQNQLDVAEFVDDYLRDKKNEFNKVVVPSSLGLSDPVLNGYIETYNKAQIERQTLLNSNIPPANPVIKEQNALIEKVRESILENLKNIKSNFHSVINDLKQKSGTAEAQIRALPLKTKEYMEIKRVVDSKMDLYKFLQGKKEETAISRAATLGNSKVIEKAAASNTPIKPNRRAVQLLAILAGLGLPALFIFVGELLNDKITTRFDIEKITPVPILGEIGHSFLGSILIVNKTTRSMVAEQFRIIRSNLQYVLGKNTNSVILVTSSFSGEGKSFVCTNLGAVMALAGKKTVILEFDIRKPKIITGLSMPKTSGITNILVGRSNVEELIRPVQGNENLFVLGCGPVPPNPAELLLEKGVENLFSYLRQNFDVIIVDTAPVGMVSDAMTLSKFADCTLYLVRQGHTFKKQIALIDDFYRENKLPRISIVINDVKIKPGYGYYGYGRYGYGYGYNYKSYYEEEKEGRNPIGKVLRRIGIRK